jgi:hypothetical protein
MPFANIDTGRTNLDTDPAIDAIALGEGLWINTFLARAAGLATFRVVGDDQRIRIEHDPLEAGIGTHVLADLLAHHTGKQISETAVEEDPEELPRTKTEGKSFIHQFANRREVAYQGEARPQGYRTPCTKLRGLDAQLAPTHGGSVQLHALAAISLDLLFNPHEDLGIDRLRTGIATP